MLRIILEHQDFVQYTAYATGRYIKGLHSPLYQIWSHEELHENNAI